MLGSRTDLVLDVGQKVMLGSRTNVAVYVG